MERLLLAALAAPSARPVSEHCAGVGPRAPTGPGPKMWNPDDPVRHVGVRNETAKAETQREAAKPARHVQHDSCMSADAGVCTLALESAGISGPQPWIQRSSDGAKMQNCVRGGRRDLRVNDP